MNFTTLIVNSTVEFPMSNEVINEIPHLKMKANSAKISIECPLNIEFKHVNLLSKIMKKISVIPLVDAKSHGDVYTVIKFAKFLGIDDTVIASRFGKWSTHCKWIDLWHPEYLYLIYIESEDLVDFKRFFSLHPKAIESIPLAVKLVETLNPHIYIDMLLFFKNYNFTLCFDQNNDVVQNKIAALCAERLAIWETFMINPHSKFVLEYLKYTPTMYQVWDCKDISIINPPIEDEMTIVDINTARERLRSFSFELLEKSPNPNVKTPFPFQNVIIAGGAVAKILALDYNERNAKQSDVDLFIFAKTFEERSRVFEEVINWFKTYNKENPSLSNTYYAMRGSVTTVYVKDIERKFQIISINSNNPYDVISRFDLTHIQWCVWNNQFYGLPEACRSMREKITRFNNTKILKISRLIKALHCGYSVIKDVEIMEKYIDISPLVEQPKSLQTQKLIRDLYGWYYPQSRNDVDPEDLRQHILCQIEKDANATLVTDDPNFVIGNVVIGGNFENDYESVLYTTFNPVMIQNHIVGRRVQKILLRSKHGAIRLTTGILKVSKIVLTDGGIEITAKNSEEAFKDFCSNLEGQVFRMFRQAEVTRHILDTHGELKFIIPKYRLDQQNVRGISCMRSQRGVALNIEEDLKEGDDIQILFIIEINIFPELRAVELKPVKFVKYQKVDSKLINQTVSSMDENIEKEIEQLSAKSDFTGEITYDNSELDTTLVKDKKTKKTKKSKKTKMLESDDHSDHTDDV